jgi:hypothetical protein
MAVTCARCGAQNPDGNSFCSACGTPLTAAAATPQAGPPTAPPSWLAAPPQQAAPAAPAAGAPAAYASPPPAPVAYASPYYAPAGAMPQAPVHRSPWVLIIAAVVALIVVMAGCGTAIALLGGKASISGGITPDVPSPSPAGSPSPVASPVAVTGPTASNPVVTVPVPAGWAVSAKDNESITLSDPNGLGFVSVASGQQNPHLTAQQQKNGFDTVWKQKYPDTVECGGVRPTTGSLGGVQGIFWQLCFTIVSSGRSLPAETDVFVGTNADGSVWYGVILLTAQTYMQNLKSESAPILRGIQWKLK